MTARLALLLCAVACSLRAQETRATVTGQVRDPSGSSDPNSAITILKVETGVRTKIGSNDAGACEAAFLIQAVQTRLVQITSRMTF